MVISEAKRRIGVMGGSFNPVHYGHLRVASDVKQQLELDHMFLMPAAQSPLKVQHSVSARHRVAMLELAIEAFPELELDLREVNRAGRSFTVDSLSALRREFGREAMLYFVIGDDCLASLNQWRRWRDIVSFANLIIAKRPGPFPPPEDEVAEWLESTQVDCDIAGSMPSGGVARVDCALLDISSTQLRIGLEGHDTLNQVIPEPVIEYIKHHGLYR
jgi:nicotinate-nucleotide adenylyltransferase